MVSSAIQTFDSKVQGEAELLLGIDLTCPITCFNYSFRMCQPINFVSYQWASEAKALHHTFTEVLLGVIGISHTMLIDTAQATVPFHLDLSLCF